MTPTEGLIELNKSEFTKDHSPYKMDKFRGILTDPFYASILEVDKQIKIRNENGLHEPMITKEQHYKLVSIMSKRPKVQSGPRKNGNPKYPMSNLVTCDFCREKRNGRVVGYDHGNGHSNLIYEKYRCRACGRLISRQELHIQVARLFTDNPVSRDGLKDLLDALSIVWKQQEIQNGQETKRLQAKIKFLNDSITQQVEAAIDPRNLSVKDEILSAIAKKKLEVAELENDLSELNDDAKRDYDDFLKFAFGFVENMSNRFLSLSPDERARCKQIIFPGGFHWSLENKVYTTEVSPLIRLTTKKKSTEVLDNSHLVQHS